MFVKAEVIEVSVSLTLSVKMDWVSHPRGDICHSRHCRRQCKIFTSGVNFSGNNVIYNINESTKYILSWFHLWNCWHTTNYPIYNQKIPKWLIFDAFTPLICEKKVANYALLQCKKFSLKIWLCKIFDKFHVWWMIPF